jgi:uncharacterized membrane protein
VTDAAGTRSSRRRWLIIALTVSVALNLFLVGVFASHMHRHRGPPPQAMAPRERLEHIAADLELNDAQKAAFGQFETTLRQHGATMRRANMADWAKIAEPATGPDQIAPLLADTVKNRTAFQQDVADAMGKFLASLTPAQRAAFIEEARNPGHHRMRH